MIMIAGGSGFFGINVARCLADRGEEIVLVQRHPMQETPLLSHYWGKQVRQTAGDLLDLPFLLFAREGKYLEVQEVVHG
jgi:nucleoside-diphosphate-sugar epimerase